MPTPSGRVKETPPTASASTAAACGDPQPTHKPIVRQDREHAIMDLRDQFVAGSVTTANVLSHLPVSGSRPFSDSQRHRTASPRDARLRDASTGALLSEAVHRHDAAALAVGVPATPFPHRFLRARQAVFRETPLVIDDQGTVSYTTPDRTGFRRRAGPKRRSDADIFSQDGLVRIADLPRVSA